MSDATKAAIEAASRDKTTSVFVLLRQLQMVIQAGIFGIPATEVIKWNQRISQVLDATTTRESDAQPSQNLLRHYKIAAHETGDLFCWCVQNLDNFPPMEGNWTDEVKKRLYAAEHLKDQTQ